ncbi:MAG: O-antigen ligase family protein [Candidatus Moraniibacteriota bacterium]
MQKLQDDLFFLFLFILPFQTVYLWREPIIGGGKWQYGTIGIYASSLVLACAIVLGALLKAKALKSESIGVRMKKMWRERKSDAFLLLFVLWSGLSIIWAQDTALAGYTFVKILLAADAFIMTRDLVRRGKMKQIVLVLFVAAMIQSVIGIGQFLTQETFSSTLLGTSAYESWQSGTSVLKNDTGRFLRAYGTFPHPNLYGLFLAVVLLIVTERIDSFVLTPQSRRLDSSPLKGERATLNICNYNTLTWLGKFLPPPLCVVRIEEGCGWYAYFQWVASLFGILIILLGLIVSFSRLAWGGFALGFVFLSLKTAWNKCICHSGLRAGIQEIINTGSRVKSRSLASDRGKPGMTRRYRCAYFSTIVISTVIFAGILHETVFPRFDGGVVDREGSVVDRMSTYRDAFQIVRAHSFLGVGVGNETAELIRLHPDRPIWDIQPAHDVLLLVCSELGIPGLVLSLCFFFSLFIPKNREVSSLQKKTKNVVIPAKPVLGPHRGAGISTWLPESFKRTTVFPNVEIFLVLIPSLLLDHFLWDSNFGLLFLFVILGTLEHSKKI